MKRIGYLSLTALAMAVAGSANAIVFNFAGVSNQSGDILHASVEFLVSGTSLTVIVTNTDDNAAYNGADVLSSVYWDMTGSPTVSNGNAALTAGSFMEKINHGAPGTVNPFNNEWFWKAPNPGYIPDLSQLGPHDYSFGATGAVNFSPTNDSFDKVFHGGTGTGGANDDYGLVPTDGQTVGNSSNVYCNNSMTFTFDLSSAISESDIHNVTVSYGSGAPGSGTVVTPEPASMGAVAIGIVALLRRRLRRA